MANHGFSRIYNLIVNIGEHWYWNIGSSTCSCFSWFQKPPTHVPESALYVPHDFPQENISSNPVIPLFTQTVAQGVVVDI